MKVFIVTSGSYSDYHIEYVASTYEKAEEYIQDNCDDDVNPIEEYEVDEKYERKTTIYWCSVNTKTDKITVESRTDEECSFYAKSKDLMKLSRFGYEKLLYFYISTDSMDKARRITEERWAQVKALWRTCFPRLFEKCVAEKHSIGYDFRYADLDYPTYNFITKEVCLKNGQYLVEDLEKEREELKRQGFIVDFH